MSFLTKETLKEAPTTKLEQGIIQKLANLFVRFFPLIALFVGGSILAIFGSWRVVAPVSSMTLLGMAVDATDTSILNELRGNHALNMGFGLLAWLALWFKGLRTPALIGLTFCFGFYLTGRLVGVAMDGLPNAEIQSGMLTETFLVTLSGLGLLVYSKTKRK